MVHGVVDPAPVPGGAVVVGDPLGLAGGVTFVCFELLHPLRVKTATTAANHKPWINLLIVPPLGRPRA
jgi:hypothetical protein